MRNRDQTTITDLNKDSRQDQTTETTAEICQAIMADLDLEVIIQEAVVEVSDQVVRLAAVVE